MADEDGFVTEELINFYVTLARGGAGLIITGNALVHVSGRSAPKMICIHNDFYVEGLKNSQMLFIKLVGNSDST